MYNLNFFFLQRFQNIGLKIKNTDLGCIIPSTRTHQNSACFVPKRDRKSLGSHVFDQFLIEFTQFISCGASSCDRVARRFGPWWRLTWSRQHSNGGCRGGSSSGRLVRSSFNALSLQETRLYDRQTFLSDSSDQKFWRAATRYGFLELDLLCWRWMLVTSTRQPSLFGS